MVVLHGPPDLRSGRTHLRLRVRDLPGAAAGRADRLPGALRRVGRRWPAVQSSGAVLGNVRRGDDGFPAGGEWLEAGPFGLDGHDPGGNGARAGRFGAVHRQLAARRRETAGAASRWIHRVRAGWRIVLLLADATRRDWAARAAGRHL